MPAFVKSATHVIMKNYLGSDGTPIGYFVGAHSFGSQVATSFSFGQAGPSFAASVKECNPYLDIKAISSYPLPADTQGLDAEADIGVAFKTCSGSPGGTAGMAKEKLRAGIDRQIGVPAAHRVGVKTFGPLERFTLRVKRSSDNDVLEKQGFAKLVYGDVGRKSLKSIVLAQSHKGKFVRKVKLYP